MKTLIRLAKKSAKNIQKKLLQNGEPYCNVLNTNISITKLFLNHITYSKNRSEKEVIQRLLIAGFIEEIFANGTMLEKRIFPERITHRIGLLVGNDIFSIIITYTQENKNFFLLSCFLEHKYTKRDLSQPPMVYHAQGVQVS
jgi:hypothetical protein